MIIVALTPVVQTGPWRAVKGKPVEVPDLVAREWIAGKFARPATEAEIARLPKPAAAAGEGEAS